MSTTAQTLAGKRIESLLDENSFVEIGGYVTARNTDFNMQQKETPADGVITGYGLIEGNLVYVYSQDVSVMNGTIGVESQRGKGSKFFFSVSFGLSKNKQDSDSKKWYKDRNKVVREKKGNRQLEQLKRYIELKEWKKAETLAGIIKHKIATQDEKLKQSIFRLELDLRKKDYDRAGKQMEQIISIARHKK